MKIGAYIFVIAATLCGGCLSGSSSYRADYDFESVDKIAIVAVEGGINSEAAKDQIADFYAQELLDKGYAPIARQQVKASLQENKIDPADLTNTAGAIEAGKILKVPAVLVVNIPNFNEEISMTAKLIDVADGTTLWMGRGTGKTGLTLTESFLGTITGQGTSKQRNVVLSGPMADILGQQQEEPALSPLEAQKIQKVVAKICSSLPVKFGANSNRW
jgi:hypothetical protein